MPPRPAPVGSANARARANCRFQVCASHESKPKANRVKLYKLNHICKGSPFIFTIYIFLFKYAVGVGSSFIITIPIIVIAISIIVLNIISG